MAQIRQTVILAITILMTFSNTEAQHWQDEKWYENPLGFEPVKLHTSMGFIIPATLVGGLLLLTEKDPNLKKRISIYNETGLSWGYKYPNTSMPQNNTGVCFQLRKFMSVGVEFGIYLPKDDFNKTMGVGIRPFARFYPVNNERWRIYFESGGGFIYLRDEFPKPTDRDNRLGTFWNGITKYGIGSEINVSKSTAVLFGVRHLHISNGNKKGVERNPSHDSNGVFLGLSYKL